MIENAQRDINIAFMNEITQIFAETSACPSGTCSTPPARNGTSCRSSPGLVGGHCIGVDPYYLSHRRSSSVTIPRSSWRAGRSTTAWAAGLPTRCTSTRRKAGSALVLGLTFKEDVPDLRNSKVIDVIHRLEALGHK